MLTAHGCLVSTRRNQCAFWCRGEQAFSPTALPPHHPTFTHFNHHPTSTHPTLPPNTTLPTTQLAHQPCLQRCPLVGLGRELGQGAGKGWAGDWQGWESKLSNFKQRSYTRVARGTDFVTFCKSCSAGCQHLLGCSDSIR